MYILKASVEANTKLYKDVFQYNYNAMLTFYINNTIT